MILNDDFLPLVATSENLKHRFVSGIFLGFAFGLVFSTLHLMYLFNQLDRILVCK